MMIYGERGNIINREDSLLENGLSIRLKAMSKKSIRFFNGREIRVIWGEENSKWWSSATDILREINNEDDYVKSGYYLRWLKKKLNSEGVQVNEDRVFFKIKSEQPLVDGYQDVTKEVSEAKEKELTDNCHIAEQKASLCRPSLNFHKMGLNDGDTLVDVEAPNIIVVIVGPQKVRFEYVEETSLTAITTRLRNSKYSLQPTPWLTFEGKNLSDIYNETSPFEEE